MHDHGQPTRQGDDRLLHSAMPGNLHRPGLEPRPFRRMRQHALGRFVEHHPRHLVSAPRYPPAAVALARVIPRGCQSKHRPDRLGVSEAGRYIDGCAIGQRYHGTDTRNRHQTPAHVIVPDDSQQAAMQDSDLFTKHPPDNEQRLDRTCRRASGSLATLASRTILPASSTMQTLVSLTDTSSPDAALLLLMLEAAYADLVSPSA